VALTAVDVRDASTLEKLGVHVVLRPFRDASEQAVDNLTQAMALLPKILIWPVAFKEIRIETAFSYAGKALNEIPLRQSTGVSILAVSRAGKFIMS
jgi:K+/H+ antiporter YhaU regulatory subunit KhtT